MLLGACTNAGQDIADPIELQTPDATARMGVQVEENDVPISLDFNIRATTIYYPDGADAESAAYVLTFSLPLFDEASPSGVRMNEALDIYREELLERVNAERVPFADGSDSTPYTSVACEIDVSRGYLNVRLFESVCFAGNVEIIPFVMVLEESSGLETSLHSLCSIYQLEEVIAQQIYNAVERERESFLGDISIADILLYIDLYNGFAVTDEGCLIYLPAGTLAPEARGTLGIALAQSALLPAFVGESINEDEYALILPMLDALAAASAPYYESFAQGNPPAYVASAFLSAYFTAALKEEKRDQPYLSVPRAEYEAVFAASFTGDFPPDLNEAGDGTMLDVMEENYLVPIRPSVPYRMRVDDAIREENGLLLYAMVMFGTPGSGTDGELAAATLELQKDASSPWGYRFISMQLQ